MRRYLLAAILATCGSSPGWAIIGSDLALNSGSDNGANAQLDRNGYAGTYISLAAAGDVTVTVNASGAEAGGVNPHLSIVIADMQTGFDVTPSFNEYSHTFTELPAGTYFVRAQLDNDTAVTARSLTIGSLTVSGAAESNDNSDANALAAADTYIQNFRRGSARVGLVGAAPDSEVHVQLKRHAFNFGANIHGTGTSILANAQYTDFFKSHFNMVVPSRAGKWNNNESTRDTPSNNTVTMGVVDAMLDFADANNMRARMHNLIWGNDSTSEEQPAWVVTMLQNPNNADSVTGLTNLNALRQVEIPERIDYYVGDGPGGFEDQAPRYAELDVYNESWHTGVNTPGSSVNYWDRLTAAGVSTVYEQAAQAVAEAGATTKLYVNEYNILQNGNDSYGNWYREHLETIENADGDPNDRTVSGIGMQLYALDGHGATYMQQVLQNMSVTGLPLTLSEFGVQDDDATPTPDIDEPTMLKIVEDSLRMMFGSPNAGTFMYWGFWAGATSDLQRASALADASWNLTNAGRLYEDLLGIDDWDGDPDNGWTTDLTLPVGADGTIDFTGFYGDYELTLGGQTYDLLLSKGDAVYSLVIAPGDYNGDGIVDAGDYTLWRDTFGSVDDLRADGNGNEMIDQGDYDVWKSLFGTTYSSGAGSAAPVPEPSSAVLMAIVVGMACLRRRGQDGRAI